MIGFALMEKFVSTLINLGARVMLNGIYGNGGSDEVVDDFESYASISVHDFYIQLLVSLKTVTNEFVMFEYKVDNISICDVYCAFIKCNMFKAFIRTLYVRRKHGRLDTINSCLGTTFHLYEDGDLLNKILRTDFKNICKERSDLYDELCLIPGLLFNECDRKGNVLSVTQYFTSVFDIDKHVIDELLENIKSVDNRSVLLRYVHDNSECFECNDKEIVL